DIDPALFGEAPPAPSVRAAAEGLIPYIERETSAGVRLYAIVRHVLGLFQGVPGARAFRRHLAEEAVKRSASAAAFRAALAKLMDGKRDMGDMAA
ncbi:MAG: tRNA-dihydrouridine synthase, partial [Rhodoplanes sp.]